MRSHVDDRVDVRLFLGGLGRVLWNMRHTYERNAREIPEDNHETPSERFGSTKGVDGIIYASLFVENIPGLRDALLTLGTNVWMRNGYHQSKRREYHALI